MATYKIQKGDTLSKIAKQYGVSVTDLAKLNNIGNVNLIRAGAELQLPGASAPQTTAAPEPVKTPADYLKQYDTSRPQYQQSQSVTDALAQLTQMQANKPGAYESPYSERIGQMLDEILARPDFKYDFNADPLYQQYKDRYQQQGQMAMIDTMGQAAALSGGYGNSYAQTAGQQTYQNYLQGANDVIPQLRQAALDQYSQQGNQMAQNLALTQSQEDQSYGRYMDDYNKYLNELQYQTGRADQTAQQEYNRFIDEMSAWESDRNYWMQRQQADQEQQNWLTQLALSTAGRGGGGGGGGGSRSGGDMLAELLAKANRGELTNGALEEAYNKRWIDEEGLVRVLAAIDAWDSKQNSTLTDAQKAIRDTKGKPSRKLTDAQKTVRYY